MLGEPDLVPPVAESVAERVRAALPALRARGANLAHWVFCPRCGSVWRERTDKRRPGRRRLFVRCVVCGEQPFAGYVTRFAGMGRHA